jgi:sorting nexin-8
LKALHELLLSRFPYRTLPRLPPAKLSAMLAGVDSRTIDTRRKALARWLTAVTSHPVLREDPMLRFFLTETGAAAADMGATLRELYRHLPDEFVVSRDGPSARDERVSLLIVQMTEVGLIDEKNRGLKIS